MVMLVIKTLCVCVYVWCVYFIFMLVYLCVNKTPLRTSIYYDIYFTLIYRLKMI